MQPQVERKGAIHVYGNLGLYGAFKGGLGDSSGDVNDIAVGLMKTLNAGCKLFNCRYQLVASHFAFLFWWISVDGRREGGLLSMAVGRGTRIAGRRLKAHGRPGYAGMVAAGVGLEEGFQFQEVGVALGPAALFHLAHEFD